MLTRAGARLYEPLPFLNYYKCLIQSLLLRKDFCENDSRGNASQFFQKYSAHNCLSNSYLNLF